MINYKKYKELRLTEAEADGEEEEDPTADAAKLLGEDPEKDKKEEEEKKAKEEKEKEETDKAIDAINTNFQFLADTYEGLELKSKTSFLADLKLTPFEYNSLSEFIKDYALQQKIGRKKV